MSLSSGDLIHRITVRRRTPPVNNGGVPVPAEPVAVHSRIAARVIPASASRMERVFAGQVLSVATHTVRLRFVPLQLTDEVVWHDEETGQPVDRFLHIVGRHEDGKKTEMTLAVQERMS